MPAEMRLLIVLSQMKSIAEQKRFEDESIWRVLKSPFCRHNKQFCFFFPSPTGNRISITKRQKSTNHQQQLLSNWNNSLDQSSSLSIFPNENASKNCYSWNSHRIKKLKSTQQFSDKSHIVSMLFDQQTCTDSRYDRTNTIWPRLAMIRQISN